MSVCYTTGTFDLIHRGQIEYLKTCKQLVHGKLLVGLTTDDLAKRQKRKPVMTYEQRRNILIEFPFVDAVVAHDGEPKEAAWKRLHFTDLAIGAEYVGTPEYTNMEKLVKVHYIPCPTNRIQSSSDIHRQLERDAADRIQVIANGGPSGIILKYSDIILKLVRITSKEFGNTRNVYQVPVPNPRNWKRIGAEHKYPNLPGVNGMRELEVIAQVHSFSWCASVKYAKAFEDLLQTKGCEPQIDWSHINRDKSEHVRAIYLLYQRYVGPTLSEWIEREQYTEGFVSKLNGIIYSVRGICGDLRSVGVLHGDLHAHNLCVSPKLRSGPIVVGRPSDDTKLDVGVIDFGWCLARGFELDDSERAYFEQCMQENFDFRHFVDSMHYEYGRETWFKELEF